MGSNRRTCLRGVKTPRLGRLRDIGGEVNATFVTLLASCQLHGLEPHAYLRDLFCLISDWPAQRVLGLAPANWRATSARPEAKALLDENVFRQVALGIRQPPAPKNDEASTAK